MPDKKMTAQRVAAKKFAEYWQGKGYEKGQSQPFWLSLLRDVYGVEHPEEFISFEDQVHLDHTSFIDGSIPATHVLIEQKSLDKDLDAPILQSSGVKLTPFQQAKRYSAELSYSERPRWIVTCNFAQFRVYDMEHPNSEPAVIYLKDLEEDYYRLQFLVDTENTEIKKEERVSFKAGELVGILYDKILEQYKDPSNPESLRSLNMLCVRLVFCLYAEDAGIFGEHGKFHDYLKHIAEHNISDVRRGLIDLFRVLDTKSEDRDPYMEEELASFPYVNGGLFADENIEIPRFTEEIVQILLSKASEDFNWRDISPTIFGAVFESTLNPETRRSGGMHYTSIENIHKVIDPLFLRQLRVELNEIEEIAVTNQRRNRLETFQKKLASLVFFDPACGSGNFLTETYLCLRRLENEVIEHLIALEKGNTQGQIMLAGARHIDIMVSIGQFYGIEINDFAVSVAKTALWIAESQMLEETEKILTQHLEFLPLTTNAFIHEGNALRMDWKEIVPVQRLSYIMGNPPFVGARMMNAEQKKDLNDVFPGWKNAGNLDYVSCWYKKSADLMKGTEIRTGLVSTNSVTQGESVANLWKPLFSNGVHIDFAHRTFRWDSEASSKAHVHCVIVGFSCAPNSTPKVIYTDGQPQVVKNINGYLLDADNVFVESRSKPLCNVPPMSLGNQPIDGGFYSFTKEEKDAFVAREPEAEKYFRLWMGSKEFINRIPRYFLYLRECSPAELRKLPECCKRIEAVRQFRLSSKRAVTRQLAETPREFAFTNISEGTYIVVPEVSSERRKYIPMGFLTPQILCSNLVKIVPNATLYHFGVLTSNIHNAWMRAVCGRLKSDYRYSSGIVYNNFPWPNPTEEQKAKIERTAQAILDARALYPDSSLADLYDELTMPPELRKAHQNNDRAVMQAYGMPVRGTTESSCVAMLMEIYQKLVEQEKA
ncbi:methylase [Faecalibacterium sp. An121]|uniref:DNA methyltransferase n=2 Tax=Faecalibacterium sp. An121 TaxID=1965550 RepID=UPI000B386969|nr:DNA methyltransferase [Faecalibacterium sp. An121]OUQ37222.1 methylase [Faecalibacterium sp. An121]